MATPAPAPNQGGNMKLVIVLVLLVAVLVSGGTVAALYFAGVFSAPANAASADGIAPVPVLKDPIYVPLEPPMVVNFERNGRMGFLQVTMQAMTREEAAQKAIETHMPVIRNNLLMLISSKTYADVATPEGKQQLRQEALAELNRVLQSQGVTAPVEDLYFTGFVMQ